MTISIELPTALRRFAGGQALVEVDTGATVADALSELVRRHPRLRPRLFAADDEMFAFMGIFVNDDDVRPLGAAAAVVASGDVITLVPAVAGG